MQGMKREKITKCYYLNTNTIPGDLLNLLQYETYYGPRDQNKTNKISTPEIKKTI